MAEAMLEDTADTIFARNRTVGRVALRANSSMTTLVSAMSNTKPTIAISNRNGFPYCSLYPGKPFASSRLSVGGFSPSTGEPRPIYAAR